MSDRPRFAQCAYQWPLLDPNPEDVAFGRTHRCHHLATHDTPHRCACGEMPPDGVEIRFCPLGPPRTTGIVAYAYCSECRRIRKSNWDCLMIREKGE